MLKNSTKDSTSKPQIMATLAGVRVLTVLVSSFIPALFAFGFLSSSAKSFSSPVCGFAANGGGGSVVLLGFAHWFYRFRLARRIAAGWFSFLIKSSLPLLRFASAAVPRGFKFKLLTRRITRGLRPLGCQPLRGRHPCALR